MMREGWGCVRFLGLVWVGFFVWERYTFFPFSSSSSFGTCAAMDGWMDLLVCVASSAAASVMRFLTFLLNFVFC
jgi:hypothetical protein